MVCWYAQRIIMLMEALMEALMVAPHSDPGRQPDNVTYARLPSAMGHVIVMLWKMHGRGPRDLQHSRWESLLHRFHDSQVKHLQIIWPVASQLQQRRLKKIEERGPHVMPRMTMMCWPIAEVHILGSVESQKRK